MISHSSSKTGGGEDDFQNLLQFLHGKYRLYTIFPKGERSEIFKRYSDQYLEVEGRIFPFDQFSLKKYVGFFYRNYKKIFRIYSFLKKHKDIDLCFVNSSVCFLEVLPVIIFKIPYIISIKEQFNPRIVGNLIFWFYGKTAIKILTISGFLKKEIYSVTKKRDVQVINSCLNTTVYDFYKKKYGAEIARQFKNAFFITHIGSIYRLKGQDILLKTLIKLGDEDVRLKFIGGVKDRKYFSELGKIVLKNHLQDKVNFLGELDKGYLIKEILQSDCIVVTSREEGQSLVILEALYLEIPIISTKVGIAEEVIENNVNGFLYDYGDVDTLSKILSRLKTNPILISNVRKKGLETYLKKFDFKEMMLKYENVIEEVCNNSQTK